MLVARSYSASKPEDKRPDRHMERPKPRESVRGFGWRPARYSFPASKSPKPSPPSSPAASSASAAAHHAQSVVPVAAPRQETVTKPIAVPRQESRSAVQNHDAAAVAPSVAALLAMTSIPKRKFSERRSASSPSRRLTSAQVREEWQRMHALELCSPSSSPTMDALLSPPLDNDELLASAASSLDDLRPSSRSPSSDSMPSLDRDDGSILSWAPPQTPAFEARNRLAGAKERVMSSPRTIDTVLSHPLLPEVEPADPDDEDAAWSRPRSRSQSPSSEISTDYAQRKPRNRKTSVFKSNLTASLSALRRAANSLSNFTAPSVVPADHISQGLLGGPYPSEMRPRQLRGTPTPQLRRYLNPPQHGAYADFHMHNSHLDHTDLEAAAFAVEGMLGPLPEGAIIPLQEYSEAQSSRRKSSGFATEAGRVLDESAQQRREPRENGEFLRICVLEMNMRRSGKMEGPLGAGPGRKAFWLPPRLENTAVHASSAVAPNTVPARWISISRDDLP